MKHKNFHTNSFVLTAPGASMYAVYEREEERERERVTDRQSDRQTETDRERETDRETQTDRQTVSWCFTPSQPVRFRQRQTEKERERAESGGKREWGERGRRLLRGGGGTIRDKCK